MQNITSTTTSVILASAPYDLEISSFKDFLHSYIFTNHCAMQVSEIKTNNFHLHTSSFAVISSGTGTIDASGDNGLASRALYEGLPENNLANGRDAHNVYFSSANFNVAKPIRVLVGGGNGAAGFSGLVSGINGGNGGDGGNGAFASLLYADTYTIAYTSSAEFTELREKDPRQREIKQDAWLDFCQLTITKPKELVDAIKDYADTYKLLPPEVAEERLDLLCSSIENESYRFRQQLYIDYSGGSYGVGGKGVPSDGKNGLAGADGPPFKNVRLTAKAVHDSTEMLFHPDQVAMTVRDIENDYFLGTPESLLDCAISLRTLNSRLSSISTLERTNPLYKAYNDHENEIFVLPSKTTEPTSILSLKESLKKVQSYARQLSLGLDFYGNEATWVPRGSYHFYEAQLDQVLSAFEKISNNYAMYKSIATTEAEKRDLIKQNQTISDDIITQTKSVMARLDADLDYTSRTIASLTATIPNKRSALLQLINALANEIQNHFDVSFSDFIGAATMMAFAPGLPMAALQSASLINTGITEVTSDSGINVNKSYLVNSIKAIEGTMKGLEEGVSMISGDPTIKIDDPGAAKLLLEESDLMGLISEYGNLLGGDTLQHVKDMFDDYVTTVLTRNNAVMHYNASVTSWLKANVDIISQQRQQAMLSRDLMALDPNLPGIFGFIEQAYYATTSQVLKMLYMTERALSFWSLGINVSDLSYLRRGGFIGPDLPAMLLSAKVNILNAYATAIETFTSHSQAFGSDINKTGRLAEKDPIRVYLNSGQLQTLCRNGMVMLTIPEAYPETRRTSSAFSGCADVRLARVRFYMEGAQTEDDSLLVSLEHTGSETIVSPNGLAYHFSHTPLSFQFHYNLATGKIQTDGDIGSIVNDELAAPGPFTMWRVGVSDVFNVWPDLSQVTRAWFEFSGWSRSFSY